MNEFGITISQQKLQAFCRQWHISELALFGSVLGDNFSTNSDVDVLVSFDKKAHVTLFDMVHMQDELSKIFDRDVDLISRRGIEQSRNPLRRKEILDSIEVIYAAG